MSVTTTADELHQVAHAVDLLATDVDGRNAEIEDNGRLPDDIAATLKASGVFRLWLPRELGGLEATPATVISLVRTLAAADASLGWCAAIGAGSNLVGGYLPRDGAEQVYATGTEAAGGSLMPGGHARQRNNGDLVVTGRWPFASGAYHCDWLAGVVTIENTTPPQARLIAMPRNQVTLLDTWRVAGLKGTGSTDFQADNLTVSQQHTVRLDQLNSWAGGAMWRIPLHSLLLPIMAAVPLGVADAAIAELTRLATTKTPFRSHRTLAERESTQIALARATAAVTAAGLYLTATMTALLDTARTGEAPTVVQRTAARLAAVEATRNAGNAVQTCYRTAGSTALRLDSPLQRHLRDINAATQHYALSHNGYETAGRVLLGLDPDVPL